MSKLTDPQLVILSAAAKREDRAVLPVPKSVKIKGPGLHAMLTALCKKNLLAEQPAGGDAIAWREDANGRRMMLVLTQDGLRILGGAPKPSPQKRPTPTAAKVKTRRGVRRTADAVPSAAETAHARRGGKHSLLIDLLGRKTGASLDELAAATGWQPHSIRGAISGALKKKCDLPVVSERIKNRGRVYRIGRRG